MKSVSMEIILEFHGFAFLAMFHTYYIENQ